MVFFTLPAVVLRENTEGGPNDGQIGKGKTRRDNSDKDGPKNAFDLMMSGHPKTQPAPQKSKTLEKLEKQVLNTVLHLRKGNLKGDSGFKVLKLGRASGMLQVPLTEAIADKCKENRELTSAQMVSTEGAFDLVPDDYRFERTCVTVPNQDQNNYEGH